MNTRRRTLSVLAGSLLAGVVRAEEPASDIRYREIRRLIKENLHLSAHLVRAVDARTVEAVRAQVSEADIPVLAALLHDRENVVGIGAQHVLETFGEKALPVLRQAAESANPRASTKAREAIVAIEASQTSPAR
jgi:hypothetical protein